MLRRQRRGAVRSPTARLAAVRPETLIFDLTSDQHTIADELRRLLDKEWNDEAAAAAWRNPRGPEAERLWVLLAEFGLFGVLVPEEFGGLGGSLTDTVALLEAVGAAGAPGPVLETAVVAGWALRDHPDQATREQWCRPLAQGDARFAVPTDARVPVRYAQGADAFVLPGVPSRMITVNADDVAVVVGEDPTLLLGQVHWPADAWRTGPPLLGTTVGTVDIGAFASAAQLTGAADRLLRETVAYASGRRQFGRALGTFQAVQHELAESYVWLELAREATWYASWALEETSADARQAASVAKFLVSRAASRIGAAALQFHGALGYTWEGSIHRIMKRSHALDAAFGSHLDHAAVIQSSLVAPLVTGPSTSSSEQGER